MYLNCVECCLGRLPVAVPTTDWLWFLAGHTALVPLLALEAQAALVPLMPLSLWLQAQQTSSCELYCAFYSFPKRLVTQQHFHPLLSRGCFNNTLSPDLMSLYLAPRVLSAYSLCRSFERASLPLSYCCQYPSVTCSPENSTLGRLSHNFLPINSSAGDVPVTVCGVTRYWNRKSWNAFRQSPFKLDNPYNL